MDTVIYLGAGVVTSRGAMYCNVNQSGGSHYSTSHQWSRVAVIREWQLVGRWLRVPSPK